MFDFTLDVLNFGLFLLDWVWHNGLYTSMLGFYVLTMIFCIFHKMVGFNKC